MREIDEMAAARLASADKILAFFSREPVAGHGLESTSWTQH